MKTLRSRTTFNWVAAYDSDAKNEQETGEIINDPDFCYQRFNMDRRNLSSVPEIQVGTRALTATSIDANDAGSCVKKCFSAKSRRACHADPAVLRREKHP